MTTKQEKRLVNNLNRVVVALLSLTGMLLDGGQVSDIILELAVVFWLWMPECHSLELAVLHRVHHEKTC